MKRELPEKYYLDHFFEFIEYIQSVSGHLLEPEHQAFISKVDALSDSGQCLLVRLLNRNVLLIDEASLRYKEIPDLSSALEELARAQLIRRVTQDDWPACLRYLTKDKIAEGLNTLQLSFKSSDKKQALMDVLTDSVSFDDICAIGLFDGFWVKACESIFEYLLFLFFGDVESRLNQFSLRDLGVRKTQGKPSQPQARFASKTEAISCFVYAQKLKALKNAKHLDWMALASELNELPAPQGDTALALYGKYTLKLARQLEKLDESLALQVYEQCPLPESEERTLRLQYKFGELEQVQARLDAILNEAGSEHLLLFAEDFLARKFNQKKTSRLTDVLRAAAVIPVDEMFRHNVEQGVCNFYRRQGIQAFETENGLWRALFGLTYSPEIFTSELSVCNEFDWMPASLRDGSLYQCHQEAIAQRAEVVVDRTRYIHFLTKQATEHFGKPNGVFQWSTNLLADLLSILEYMDLTALSRLLVMMAQNYSELSAGFPDLTLIDNDQVRFEEVKAPGDSLRQNQLVTLNKLSEAGFESRVCRVEWITDSNQPYCVIDIETTGGTKEQHRVTEIGAVKVVGQDIVGRWQSLINPQRHIPKFISELTGITNDMVKDAPAFSEIASELKAFLSGSIFVAHNVNFDYGFIKAEFARLGEPFAMPKLCTVREMKRYYPGYESYGLAYLSKALDIQLANHHRAMSDAEAAAELLLMINQKRLKDGSE